MKKLFTVILALALALSAATAFADTKSGLPEITTPVVGVVFNTEFGTEGFSYALYQGFEALNRELEKVGGKVMYATSIPETSDCEVAIENLINQGCNIIYATSYGYGEYTANMADKYPDIYFNHYSGSITRNNMATYFPKNFQSEYMCGVVGGAKTKTGKIGYLISFPIPECVRMVNAFTLGAQSVNPDVEVIVKYTFSWFDPATEAATATELVNSGCDVIIAYLDSINAAVAAGKLGAYGFSYATSGINTIPDTFLTNPACDWETFFINDVKRITDGEWTGSAQWLGMQDGLVSLGEIYNSDPATVEKVEEIKKGFLDGSLDIWIGEIRDNKGNVAVAEGATLSDEELLSMMWFVEGVNGSID